MIRKKICMLGAFAVGKTSLVRRFVHGIYSEKYHTTIGVKIDKKTVAVADKTVDLIIWDLAGEDEFQKVPTSYVRGAAGYLLVADGTRAETFEKALTLQKRVQDNIGDVPFVLLTNKADLRDAWESRGGAVRVSARGWPAIETSARTGQGVEDAFFMLVKRMLGG
jgi:small GTP-binding protein